MKTDTKHEAKGFLIVGSVLMSIAITSIFLSVFESDSIGRAYYET